MTSERIEITNFKGISHLELEVKPFTVLIGPQSVGKSVTAKLLYFFKEAILEVFSADTDTGEDTIETKLLARFDKLLPEPTHTSGVALIKYYVAQEFISLNHSGRSSACWQITLSPFFKEEYLVIKKEFATWIMQRPDDDVEILMPFRLDLEQRYLKKIEEKLGPSACYIPRFIPAGRSFYSQVEKDAASFFESNALDPFVSSFGRYWTYNKNFPHIPKRGPAEPTKTNLLAAELAERLLSGKYQREGQKDFISARDGRKLPMKLWSSGQQESLPLVFLLQRFSNARLLFRRSSCFFIEEPEAHLFPSSQKNMVELISLAFNAQEGVRGLFVTTHSPYVLSTLNVLLKAGQIFREELGGDERKRISSIVPEEEAIKPSLFAAYFMDHNGCRSIIDEETHLIDGSAIDDVSGDLADQFDSLTTPE